MHRLHPLVLAPQTSGKHYGQPLPADEQLALLCAMADATPTVARAEQGTEQTSIALADAYQTCEQITRKHSKSFFFSSQFLPPAKRQAVRALYAFCRVSDDTVDLCTDDPARALAEWVCLARAPVPPHNHAVLLAWRDTCLRYHLAPALADELLAGIAMDLTISRYHTFADLWLYCYRVASVVGLLAMGITGAAPGATRYAIKLGVALQMTNILRDVGEDAQRGRVYLPTADLARFGLCADDILGGVYDDRFRALMNFEIARTRQLYAESWPGIALLPLDSRLAVGAAARTYQGILDKIVANAYDVYTYRAHLTTSEKLLLLPRIWLAVRQLGA